MVLKAPREGLELKLLLLTQKILQENALELYEMEWNASSGNLTVYIINPNTDTALLDDCVKVDRAFDLYIESEKWIPENFTLEVSSPGLFRVLTTLGHFRKVEGEEILLYLTKKIDEEKYPDFPKALRNNLKLKVRLEKTLETGLLIDAKGVKIEIPFLQIKKANLETDINKSKKII